MLTTYNVTVETFRGIFHYKVEAVTRGEAAHIGIGKYRSAHPMDVLTQMDITTEKVDV